jgi:hypothetical protein
LDPFPHLVVEELFSRSFYRELLNELPSPSEYHRQVYAGTEANHKIINVEPEQRGVCSIPKDCGVKNGVCFQKQVRLHDRHFNTGLVLTANAAPKRYPFWVQAFRLVHSMNFTSLLASRFSLPNGIGIPQWKRDFMAGSPLRNQAALRIEPTEYHLAPHIDMRSKVVTWQLFHPKHDGLRSRGMGTYFYRAKKMSFQVDDRANPEWLDYSLFDRVLEHPVLPNYFFAFAPNNSSFHGANITRDKWTGERDTKQRRTFLGFVTSRRSRYHHFGKEDWVDVDFHV